MKKLFKFLLLAVVLSVIVISCSQDSEVLPNTENEELQSRAAKTNYTQLDQMFAHLAQLPNIADMDFLEELSAMDAYAQQANITFNRLSPENSYYDAQNGATSGFDANELAILEDIDNIIIDWGFTPRARRMLQNIRIDLEGGNLSRGKVSDSLIDYLRDLEYLTISTAFASYVAAKSGDGGTNIQRRIGKCIRLVLIIAYKTFKCGTNNWTGSNCADMVYYLNKFEEECRGGSGYVDPCPGSNNPCCGITCARGYTCHDGTCVRDVEDPGCAVLGCPPGYSCNGYDCIPQ